jgi:hypothetical protein
MALKQHGAISAPGEHPTPHGIRASAIHRWLRRRGKIIATVFAKAIELHFATGRLQDQATEQPIALRRSV